MTRKHICLSDISCLVSPVFQKQEGMPHICWHFWILLKKTWEYSVKHSHISAKEQPDGMCILQVSPVSFLPYCLTPRSPHSLWSWRHMRFSPCQRLSIPGGFTAFILFIRIWLGSTFLATCPNLATVKSNEMFYIKEHLEQYLIQSNYSIIVVNNNNYYYSLKWKSTLKNLSSFGFFIDSVWPIITTQ